MEQHFQVCLLVCVLFMLIKSSSSCEGFQLKVNFLKNCGVGEQVIRVFENSTGVLNDNCEVLSYVCVETTGFMKADIEFIASNNGIPLYKTKMNGCDKPSTRTSDFSKIITLGLKTLNNCPIKPSIICENGSKVTTLVVVKRFLAVIVGPLKIIANIDHGTQGKTCIEGEFELVKK